MTVLPDPGASRAVLIGSSRFDHLEQLPAVANNLTALADALCLPTSWGLPSQNCVVVSNPASNDEVMAELRSAAKQARDTLLVYYAGHGLIDLHNALQLALPKSHQQRVESGLPYDYLRQAVLDGPAERQVIVLDCCFGGLALGAMAGTPELVDQASVEEVTSWRQRRRRVTPWRRQARPTRPSPASSWKSFAQACLVGRSCWSSMPYTGTCASRSEPSNAPCRKLATGTPALDWHSDGIEPSCLDLQQAPRPARTWPAGLGLRRRASALSKGSSPGFRMFVRLNFPRDLGHVVVTPRGLGLAGSAGVFRGA